MVAIWLLVPQRTTGDVDPAAGFAEERRVRRHDLGGDQRGDLFINLHKIRFFRAESSFAQLSMRCLGGETAVITPRKGSPVGFPEGRALRYRCSSCRGGAEAT